MKFEQKLKEKYLYSKNNNLFKRLYFLFENFRTRKLIRNYTVVGIDLLLDLLTFIDFLLNLLFLF